MNKKKLTAKYNVEFGKAIAKSDYSAEIKTAISEYEAFIENFFYDDVIGSNVIQLEGWKAMPPEKSQNDTLIQRFSIYPYNQYGGDQIEVEYSLTSYYGCGDMTSVALQNANGTLHTTKFGANRWFKDEEEIQA